MSTRIALAALLAASCAHASADPPGEAPAPAPVAHDTGEGRPRVRFDLAHHLERAELRRDGTLFVDLGTPGGAKHTWGGWLSNVGGERTLDGATAAITTRNRASLALSAEGDAATLSIRVRSLRAGEAHVYLDDREVATEPLDTEWRIIRAQLSAEQLARGEHQLLLRFDRGAELGGSRAYLAVDWIALGESTDAITAPSTEDGTITLPSTWSAGYALEVPRAARLRGVLEGPGALEVWASTDGTSARRLARIAGSEHGQRIDVELGSLTGDVARIDLRAVGGDVRLRHPAIVTLDGAAQASVPRPRNVLLYLIDTLRADRLRAYAPDTRVRTPGLSRFADRSTVVTAAHSQENWTKPSVATLLSSLFPWEHTAYSDASVVPDSVRLLPEMLGARGYATAGFVANGYVSNRFGFERGWDAWRNYIREGESTRGERVAADAIEWLDRRPADQPFFLYVHAIDPHVPYRPPESYLRMYDPEPYRGPVDFSRDATLLERIKTGGLRLGARDREHLEALYDGEVSYQDAQLAALLDALAHRGLDDDTIVVITADHGEEFWDHGSVGHGHNLFEELTHVPLLVHVPGLPPARLDGPVGLVDVVPTVLDALGEPIPAELSGRSLWPVLRGAGEDAPRAAVAGFMENWRSVVSGRFKMIARSRGRIAVYDLANDPHEQRDVSGERPITTAYLRGLLGLRLAESHGSTRARTRHRASSAAIDPELEAQLEALGYVGTSRPR